jgi:hypothetical protein
VVKPKTWFESLETVYQFAVIMLFFLGLSGSGLATAAAISLKIMKTVIREETQDIREMALFSLKDSGRLDDFIRFQEKQERDGKFTDGRRADAGGCQ